MTYLREIVWNVRGITFLISVTRLGLSEPSISAYRYVSLRFSRIRILQKKWSNLVGSRLDFPSRLAFFCRENTCSPHLFDPHGQRSPNTKRDLFVHFARKGSRCVKTKPLWPLAKIAGNWGVWRVHLRLTSCRCGIRHCPRVSPFSAFLATLQRVSSDPFMRAFVRAFANDALSELEILRFVNLMVPENFLFARNFYITNIYISNISIFRLDFLFKLLSYFMLNPMPFFAKKKLQMNKGKKYFMS